MFDVKVSTNYLIRLLSVEILVVKIFYVLINLTVHDQYVNTDFNTTIIILYSSIRRILSKVRSYDDWHNYRNDRNMDCSVFSTKRFSFIAFIRRFPFDIRV